MTDRRTLANAIRFLSIDAVEKAKSGHPGMPMGMADMAEVLWNDFLHHNPADPAWPNRDRFVLSNGHGSMLLYSLLHLSGYDLSLDDLKQFRQLHSKTPGHPEYGETPGVEATAGPLGQGIAVAVGMAIAERVLANEFNRDRHHVIDHNTYVFMGDGCMMEGISHEVCALAGTLGLGKLIAFWDDNGISIDGNTAGWFTVDTPKRFASYGWHVIKAVDGQDAESISRAITEARSVTDKPTLICCQTTIGFGSPKLAGSERCHGAPLGEEEIAATRAQLGWTQAPFEIPEEIYQQYDAREKGKKAQAKWQADFERYAREYPVLAEELRRRLHGEFPEEWAAKSTGLIEEMHKANVDLPTRKASQRCIEALAPVLPELLGGSADLTGSNNTNWSGTKPITAKNAQGNYLHYGVREFGMFAIMNGLALHGGFIPYGGTFLVFADYGRNALRLSAMMKQRVIYVLTHDAIWLGEDGPTHQPIEHAAMLRLTPGVSVWRPSDAVETAVAWKAAIERKDGPTCLLLSRQKLPAQTYASDAVKNIRRGGYVLKDTKKTPEWIVIATGSEVALACQVAERLDNVRVVSMPSTDVFDQQDKDYRESVLPAKVKRRVVIEAGASAYWHKYVGTEGLIIGIDRFGASAPLAALQEAFGFTVDAVVEKMQQHG